MSEQLIEKIKAVSSIKFFKSPTKNVDTATVSVANKAMIKTTNQIIAIGASTGGTEAIREILVKLPADMPPILVVQHMPQYFTKSFAERLDSLCKLKVKEAEDGELLTPGKALIAQGNKHMILKRSGASYYVEIRDGEMIYHQRPSVEVLFSSVARFAGANAVGIILTGMGKDGAEGLLEMKKAGAYTIGQDEKSCVVYGMPKEAVSIGAVMKVVSLEKIPQTLLDILR
jgi:two-component system chemotaxis response regulator CheB